MRKHFLTGLALLLPIVLTLLIVTFIINIITKPFLGSVTNALNFYEIFNKPFLFLSASTTLLLSSKLIILTGIAFSTLLVGFLGQVLLIKLLGRTGDYILHKIPIINKIYKTLQDMIHTIFCRKETTTAFSSVVLVPFPHSKTYSIGLITNSVNDSSDSEYQERVSVFVPGTPNPTMGFMLLFHKNQLIPIEMKVEDALKFVISCGVIYPDSAVNSSSQ
jgi:uncharacterized membrane protein